MISVLVADAQRLLAESLRVSLSLEPDMDVIDEHPSSGLDAVEVLVRTKPDVALVDYWMTGMEGPALTRLALSRSPGLKIVLLGWFHGQNEIEAAKEAGATAFLSKELSDKDLARGVRQVAHGDAAARAKPRGRQPAPAAAEGAAWQKLVSLTPREIEILSQLAICGRPQEAAKQLSITQNTMRLHIQHILAKTGARNQVEAVAMARKHGLI